MISRSRQRMNASQNDIAIGIRNRRSQKLMTQQRQSVNFHFHDFKQERLTPSFAIYNDATYFRLPSVLTKTSLA